MPEEKGMIQLLLENWRTATIAVTPEDLEKFALFIIAKTKAGEIDKLILSETSINTLDLSPRLWSLLHNAGCLTIGDVLSKGKRELLRTRNFGKKAIRELEEVLLERGLELKG